VLSALQNYLHPVAFALLCHDIERFSDDYTETD
jgi:hypothetical protein